MTSTRSSLESERLAIRLDNIPDRPDEITHCHLVKYPNWPGRQIQLHLFNGNDVFALCHTVDRETKLSCPKGHTIRQVTSRSSSSNSSISSRDSNASPGLPSEGPAWNEAIEQIAPSSAPSIRLEASRASISVSYAKMASVISLPLINGRLSAKSISLVTTGVDPCATKTVNFQRVM